MKVKAPSIEDQLIAARLELINARAAWIERDDDTNREWVEIVRVKIDHLLDHALEADCE